MEWDSLGRWFRNLLTVSAVALVLHEHIPKNAECFGTTYLMFLARKWMRIVKQTIMRVQVIIGMPLRVVQGANSCSSDFGGDHPFSFQVERDFVIWNWLVDEKLLNY